MSKHASKAFRDFLASGSAAPLVPDSVIRRDFLNAKKWKASTDTISFRQRPISGFAYQDLLGNYGKPAVSLADAKRKAKGKRVTLMPRMPRLRMPWWV